MRAISARKKMRRKKWKTMAGEHSAIPPTRDSAWPYNAYHVSTAAFVHDTHSDCVCLR